MKIRILNKRENLTWNEHLLYCWPTGLYWTSKTGYHMEMSFTLIHYYQLHVIKLVPGKVLKWLIYYSYFNLLFSFIYTFLRFKASNLTNQ